jgi:hypothetical protein
MARRAKARRAVQAEFKWWWEKSDAHDDKRAPRPRRHDDQDMSSGLALAPFRESPPVDSYGVPVFSDATEVLESAVAHELISARVGQLIAAAAREQIARAIQLCDAPAILAPGATATYEQGR